MTSVVIFDLDGTLTKPCLDFDAIRSEVGVTGPILEAMERMDAPRRREAEAVLMRHEQEAANRASLQDGAREVIETCRRRGYGTAILTRNSRRSVDTILRVHQLAVDTIRTRDDGAVKPSPEPVFSIVKELNADPAKSWMVGDYLFDIESGRGAGLTTVLMIGDRIRPDYADRADHVITTLSALIALLPGANARLKRNE